VISPERKPFRTLDGYICMLAYTDAHWRAFWTLAGTPEVTEDERYRSVGERTQNIDALYASAGRAISAKPTAWWLDALKKADIPSGPVNTFEDLRRDPHLHAVGTFRAYSHPSEGDLEVLDPGIRINREVLPIHRHQPTLGEQSEVILREAGLTAAEIAEALAAAP
jgi:crotonobetainyl-CoA:carnitine CoA-transferase CaiB-like acyl-CoA transferase